MNYDPKHDSNLETTTGTHPVGTVVGAAGGAVAGQNVAETVNPTKNTGPVDATRSRP
jgi:outer membrane lipoprotein SlyB